MSAFVSPSCVSASVLDPQRQRVRIAVRSSDHHDWLRCQLDFSRHNLFTLRHLPAHPRFWRATFACLRFIAPWTWSATFATRQSLIELSLPDRRLPHAPCGTADVALLRPAHRSFLRATTAVPCAGTLTEHLRRARCGCRRASLPLFCFTSFRSLSSALPFRAFSSASRSSRPSLGYLRGDGHDLLRGPFRQLRAEDGFFAFACLCGLKRLQRRSISAYGKYGGRFCWYRQARSSHRTYLRQTFCSRFRHHNALALAFPHDILGAPVAESFASHARTRAGAGTPNVLTVVVFIWLFYPFDVIGRPCGRRKPFQFALPLQTRGGQTFSGSTKRVHSLSAQKANPVICVNQPIKFRRRAYQFRLPRSSRRWPDQHLERNP